MTLREQIVEINKLIDEKDIEQIYDEAEQFYDWMLEDKAFNVRVGNTKVKVIFDERGKGEFFSAVRRVMTNDRIAGAATKISSNKHNLDELLLTVHELENLIKNAQLRWEDPNHKKDKKPWVEKYQHWFCPCKINGKKHTVEIVTERGKDFDRSKYYFHYLSESLHTITRVRIH